jgi:hypothetical protein
MQQIKSQNNDNDIKLHQKHAGLLKFGEYKYMVDLYKKGVLFFNTFEFFRTLEISEDGRGDKNEYSYYHYSGKGINSISLKMYPKGKEHEPIIFQGGKDLIDLTLSNSNKEYSHLYSMSAIDIEWSLKNNYIINPKNFAETKDYVVAIYDSKEFLKRVWRKINKLKCNAKSDFIEYVDKKNYTGEMGAFKKFDYYSYQNEYRIALNLTNRNPLIIKIGSIEDIAQPPISSEEFFKSPCEIKYVLDDETITKQITNCQIV